VNWDYVSADVNGDGLPDLVSARNGLSLYTRLNTTTAGSVSFSSSEQPPFTFTRPLRACGATTAFRRASCDKWISMVMVGKMSPCCFIPLR